MKRFWIVKKAPDGGRLRGSDNTVYSSLLDAQNRARYMAQYEGGAYVVLEVVDAFGPADNTVRIPIEPE